MADHSGGVDIHFLRDRARLVPGADLVQRGASEIPSILVDALAIAGR